MIAVQITVRGRVQGVGFRWWVMGEARYLGLSGYAENKADGTVEIRAQGDDDAVGRMIRLVAENPSTTARPGRVDDYDLRWVDVVPGARAFGYR
ncbi:MAG: acylphosphatase [Propionicimonas sp.]|uniref:acylphosphatase n=1 Tax=Propionicimonas sp. TaxID=1955623 RepID=UPI003D1365E8